MNESMLPTEFETFSLAEQLELVNESVVEQKERIFWNG
jgi:hypothetical protein